MAKVKPITNWDDLPKIMDAVMVANILCCSEDNVRVLARSGILPAYKIGKLVRFDRDEVREHFYTKLKMKGA